MQYDVEIRIMHTVRFRTSAEDLVSAGRKAANQTKTALNSFQSRVEVMGGEVVRIDGEDLQKMVINARECPDAA